MFPTRQVLATLSVTRNSQGESCADHGTHSLQKTNQNYAPLLPYNINITHIMRIVVVKHQPYRTKLVMT